MIEVEQLLQGKDIQYNLVEMSARAITHEDVKNFSQGVDANNDCKTILTVDKEKNQYAFFVRGMHRLDFSKIRDIVGKKVKIMSREDLKRFTHKEPGAVCPFLLENTKLYFDKRVFERDKALFGSGDHRFGLEVLTKDFKKVVQYDIVDVAQE